MGGIPNNQFAIVERREQVFVLLSQGLNETEISKRLSVDQSTVSRDVRAIKKESHNVMVSIAKEVLPYEYGKCLLSIQQVIKECWIIFQDKTGQWTNKNKIDSLKLLKEATRTKFEILQQGPLNLYVNQIGEKVEELKKDQEEPAQKNFFVLGPPPRGYNELR
jgi:hypothetical protein